MQSTARIDANILTAHVRGGKGPTLEKARKKVRKMRRRKK